MSESGLADGKYGDRAWFGAKKRRQFPNKIGGRYRLETQLYFGYNPL